MRYIYVVTDCEFDGPVPGAHSMLSFGSVVLSETGETLGEFEGVLESLDGATTDPETMAFWKKHPEAWEARLCPTLCRKNRGGRCAQGGARCKLHIVGVPQW